MSVFEIFVHHEEVRRPNNLPRDAEAPDLVPCIEWLLRYHRRLLVESGLRVVLPDGLELRGGGSGSTVTLQGTADEVVIWLAGRRQAASVTMTDDGAGASAVIRRLGV